MANFLSPVGGVAAQLLDDNGHPLAGGKLYTYVSGTTTPQVTYTTAAGTTNHTNPIILDAAGRVPSGEIWLIDGGIYKMVLKTSADVLVGTYDTITGVNSNFLSFVNSQDIQTAADGQTVFALSIAYLPGTNSLSVYVDGVNQCGPGALYAYTETDSTTVTFSEGLRVGAVVKFVTTQQQNAATADSSTVSYTPAGTGAVPTNVQDKLRESVSVLDFYANGVSGPAVDPTGVLDSTLGIQAALNSALPFQTVVFPSGVYTISAELTIVTDNLRVTGHARINAANGSQFEYMLKAVGRSNITIEHLKLDANKDGRKSTATTRYMGVALLACSDSILYNLKVQGCRGYNGIAGVGIAAAQQSVRCRIAECTVIDCGDSFATPTTDSDAFFTSGTQNVITGCIAGNCTDTGFVIESSSQSIITGCTAVNCTSGAGITNASASDKFGNVIDGLTVHNWNADGGIVIGALPGYSGSLLETLVSNVCIVAETSIGFGDHGPAIKVIGNTAPDGITDGVLLANVRVRGSLAQGIYVSQGQNVKITDSYVLSTVSACIQVANGSGHLISNCQLKGPGEFGIATQNTASVISQGNIFDGVGTGIYVIDTSSLVSLQDYWALVTVQRLAKDAGATFKSIGLSTANALSVSNSVGSPPSGTLVNKFQVDDVNGSPLGYIPVYNV